MPSKQWQGPDRQTPATTVESLPSGAQLAVGLTPDAERIFVRQGGRQKIARYVLIRDRTQEAGDRQAADRCRPAIGCRRIRTAVDHGVTDFDARSEAVYQDAPSLLLQDRHEPAYGGMVRRLQMKGYRQLSFQLVD